MKVEINNQQKTKKLNPKRIETLLRKFLTEVRDIAPDRRWDTISLALMDDAGMTAMNRQYFGKERPTDVISFTYDPLPGESAHAGEVLINASLAWVEGQERGSTDRELALYIAHGCLHLVGLDDQDEKGRARMRLEEQRLIQEAERAGCLFNLFAHDTG